MVWAAPIFQSRRLIVAGAAQTMRLNFALGMRAQEIRGRRRLDVVAVRTPQFTHSAIHESGALREGGATLKTMKVEQH